KREGVPVAFAEVPGRPGCRHVPGDDRGGGADGRAVPAAAPPLRARAPVGSPRPRPHAPARAPPAERQGPQPHRHPRRLPAGRSGAGAGAVAEAIRGAGGEAATVQADLAVSGDVRRLVAQVDARLGPVSVLVNNAGPFADTTFRTLTERDWDYVMTTNLKAVF